MRKKTLLIVLVFLLTFSFAPSVLATDTTPADGYNDHDFIQLQTFLNQPSVTVGITNGESLSDGYNPADPITWAGVTWSDGAEKHITNIAFGDGGATGGLAGTLDVSGCTALENISCYNNALTSLDVSGCTSLMNITCGDNVLTSLNVSECTALIGINCTNNALTSLDVSGRTEMIYLLCENNALTSLDVSDLSKLRYLECETNSLTSLDVSDLEMLDMVYCFENELTSLDVSGCTMLTQIVCYDNALTSIDVSGLTELTLLSCGNNAITSLDYTTLTMLHNLTCPNNPLTSLDVSSLTSLTVLDCSDTGLTSLDVSNLTNLCYLYCSDNALTSLDVSSLVNLDELHCANNELTSLDVSNLIWLQEFDCSGNELTSMEASLTQEERRDEDMASLSFRLTEGDDEEEVPEEGLYISTVGNPLIQATVNLDDNVFNLTATDGGYVEIDGDNYEFIANPQASARFVNWTNAEGNQVATTEAITFDYETTYDLTANFEILTEPTPTPTPNPTPTPTPTPGTGPLVNITGVLINHNGSPLVGYTVELYSTPRTVITDGNGKYTFANVEVDDHTLIVKNTAGVMLKTFTVKMTQGANFDWDENSGAIEIETEKNTVSIDVTIMIDGEGKVTVMEITNVTNPETGGGISLPLIVAIAFALAAAIIAATVLLRRVAANTRK